MFYNALVVKVDVVAAFVVWFVFFAQVGNRCFWMGLRLGLDGIGLHDVGHMSVYHRIDFDLSLSCHDGTTVILIYVN